MKLDDVDFSIMSYMERDPRSPIARIAKRLRLPHSTVRHRLNRLIRHRVIEFSAVSNPRHFGFQIWTIFEIKATPPRIREVARRLAEAPEVYFVAIMTGGYDINVSAVFRSHAELLDFVTRRISKIPGIVSTSTAMVLELLKRTGFSAPSVAGNSAGRPLTAAHQAGSRHLAKSATRG
jgi:Lrp/AsnC family transcriptional regulator for asnA, asnC and gidA